VACAEKLLEKEVIDAVELKQLVDAHSPGPLLVPGTTQGRRGSLHNDLTADDVSVDRGQAQGS
jgi:hypothetical protein